MANRTHPAASASASHRPRRRAEVLLAVVAALGGGGVGVYVTLLAVVVASVGSTQLHIRAFTPEFWNDPGWKESAGVETHYHSIRQQMVDDLIASHLRVGMTREEVVGLIGPGDSDPYFETPTEDRWIYYLGAERAVGIDNEWLIVNFADGVLESTHLATD